VGLAIGWNLKPVEQPLGRATADFINTAGDVFGTKTGTTTVGANFRVTGSGGQSATTTYVTRLGNAFKEAIYTIKIKKASSSANMMFEVQGSNDFGCATTTASTPIDTDYSVDMPTPDDINWFSAGDHFKNKVHATSFGNASSTSFLVWSNPQVGVGNEIILTDLNYECLKLNVSGSSTNAWAQIKIR
jgi:hypothetical protein